MGATEQLSGLEMMAVNPVKRILAPRFLAGLISMPLLAAIFSAVGVFGGYFVGVGLLGVDAGAFWSQIENTVDFYDDILNGVIKSVVFGFGSGAGWALAVILLAGIRDKLRYANVPKGLEGTGITFIVMGLMAMSFMGLSGIYAS